MMTRSGRTTREQHGITAISRQGDDFRRHLVNVGSASVQRRRALARLRGLVPQMELERVSDHEASEAGDATIPNGSVDDAAAKIGAARLCTSLRSIRCGAAESPELSVAANKKIQSPASRPS